MQPPLHTGATMRPPSAAAYAGNAKPPPAGAAAPAPAMHGQRPYAMPQQQPYAQPPPPKAGFPFLTTPSYYEQYQQRVGAAAAAYAAPQPAPPQYGPGAHAATPGAQPAAALQPNRAAAVHPMHAPGLVQPPPPPPSAAAAAAGPGLHGYRHRSPAMPPAPPLQQHWAPPPPAAATKAWAAGDNSPGVQQQYSRHPPATMSAAAASPWAQQGMGHGAPREGYPWMPPPRQTTSDSDSAASAQSQVDEQQYTGLAPAAAAPLTAQHAGGLFATAGMTPAAATFSLGHALGGMTLGSTTNAPAMGTANMEAIRKLWATDNGPSAADSNASAHLPPAGHAPAAPFGFNQMPPVQSSFGPVGLAPAVPPPPRGNKLPGSLAESLPTTADALNQETFGEVGTSNAGGFGSGAQDYGYSAFGAGNGAARGYGQPAFGGYQDFFGLSQQQAQGHDDDDDGVDDLLQLPNLLPGSIDT